MEMTLRMPSSYVDIDRDEMEYVDGGGYLGEMEALIGALAACAAVCIIMVHYLLIKEILYRLSMV